MGAYYNEFDPQAAEWLRELIKRAPDRAFQPTGARGMVNVGKSGGAFQ